MVKKNKFITIVTVLIFVVSLSFRFGFTGTSDLRKKHSSFLVQDVVNKRVSKNDLKEDIGGQLKDALFKCAFINKEIGNLQLELSSLQQKLLSRVEALIENKNHFKKANRRQLEDALQMMQKVCVQLKSQETNIKQIKVTMNKNRCFKDDERGDRRG